jgi:serine/threonine-protein kinase
LLHGELSQHPRAVRRFLSEGYAANKVGHPGVVEILDDGQEPDGTMFLVMELLEGETLAQRFEKHGRLEPSEVATVAVGVLDVLAAAHDAGIVHRDIKPSNVFRTTEGEIKVLDFGAARIREAEDFVTTSGTTLGTPAFMAPELAAGRVEEVDARTDLWAVGATMFQLLTGTTAHGARSANEAIVSAATRPAPAIANIRPELAAALAKVVDRALAFEKNDRWPNARAMQAELLAIHPEAVAQRRVVEDSTKSLPESLRPRGDQRNARRWGFALTAMVALAAAIGVVVTLRAKPKVGSNGARDTISAAPVQAAVEIPPAPPASTARAPAALEPKQATAPSAVQPPSPSSPPPVRRAPKPKPSAGDFAIDGMFDKRR